MAMTIKVSFDLVLTDELRDEYTNKLGELDTYALIRHAEKAIDNNVPGMAAYPAWYEATHKDDPYRYAE